ncbi:MAG: 50S ribosomal protein L19 [Candidatus Saccharimonadales bacterium]
MSGVIETINRSNMKAKVVLVRSGDTVRVHQRVREGSKERVQVFQGLVIKTSKQGGHLNRIIVRRVSGGVGVEKSFLLHSPLIVKVEVTKRSKVRRNYLSYMRDLTGKAARLSGVDFDRQAINDVPEEVKPDTQIEAEQSEAVEEVAEVEIQTKEDSSKSEEELKEPEAVAEPAEPVSKE